MYKVVVCVTVVVVVVVVAVVVVLVEVAVVKIDFVDSCDISHKFPLKYLNPLPKS